MAGPRLFLKNSKHEDPAEIRQRADGHELKIVKLKLLQHVGVEVRGRKVDGHIENEEKSNEFALFGTLKSPKKVPKSQARLISRSDLKVLVIFLNLNHRHAL